MGFNDTSNKGLQFGLALSLGLHDYDHRQRDQSQEKRKDGPSKYNKAYPSLTLGLSHGDEQNNIQSNSNTEISSTRSMVSSLVSNFSSIKREREEFLGEDFEVEKVTSNSKGEVCNTRKKLRLTKQQSKVLEEYFIDHSTLNPNQKQELAMKLNLSSRQVEVWFQNRRARTKLKQTESDCELLKKYYETLTEENNILQKELQQVKSLQTSPEPFPMKIPSPTLTICPFCERLCSVNVNGSSSTTTMLLIGQNGRECVVPEHVPESIKICHVN